MSRSQKIVVQTANVLVEEKELAEEYAKSEGFDSLQDALRFVIRKMAKHSLSFTISDNFVSPEIESQIGESLKDLKNGKSITYTGDLDQLLSKVD